MKDIEELRVLQELAALRRSRHVIKDRSNPMEEYDNQEFRQRYR